MPLMNAVQVAGPGADHEMVQAERSQSPDHGHVSSPSKWRE